MSALEGQGAPLGTGASPFSVEHLSARPAIETNLSSYTWTEVPFGDEDPDRYIHVAYTGLKAASGLPSQVTIGGVVATIVNHVGSGAWSHVFHAYAKVPEGSSGTVVCQFSSTQDAGVIDVYRVVNPGNLPTTDNDSHYAAASGVTSVSVSPALTEGSYVIANTKADNANAVTWTNLDEQFDVAFANGNRRASAAFRQTDVSGVKTLTVAGSGSTLRRVHAIEWLP